MAMHNEDWAATTSLTLTGRTEIAGCWLCDEPHGATTVGVVATDGRRVEIFPGQLSRPEALAPLGFAVCQRLGIDGAGGILSCLQALQAARRELLARGAIWPGGESHNGDPL